MPGQWYRQQLLRQSQSQTQDEAIPEAKATVAPVTNYYNPEVKMTPELEAAYAERDRLKQLADMTETPEYQRFSATAHAAGLKNPERKMEAFEAFQNSGTKDPKAFLGRLQANFPRDFEMSANQKMNAFLRSK